MKSPETVRFYNETIYGVDSIDQIAKKFSVKAPSRSWLVHTFYNILDRAAINVWIIYIEVTGEKKINRQANIQLLADESSQNYPSDKNKATQKSFRDP